MQARPKDAVCAAEVVSRVPHPSLFKGWDFTVAYFWGFIPVDAATHSFATNANKWAPGMVDSPAVKSREFRVRYLKDGSFGRSGIRAIPGTFVVAGVTAVCYALRLDLTVTAFLYLIIVVLQSLMGDFVSSAIVSVVADLSLNFFFVPPVFSLRVSDSSDFWALIAFLVTGLVITRLTTKVRHEVEVSELQRREMNLLYELAQRLFALDPREEMLTRSVVLFRTVFDLQAVCLFDGINAELYSDGDSPNGLADRTRTAYISCQDSDDAVAGVFTRVLRASGNAMGAIGFDGLTDAGLTAGPLAELATAILERARVFRAATHADAAAQAEVFRGAILDALAHEFKTPLATIVTAAGALRETGGLRPEQLELAETAETEASRLGLLTSRLLRIARLDREEVKPQLELTDLAELVTHLAEQYAERWTDRKVSLSNDADSTAVLADAELLRLAVRQLLDNACKYSHSGAAIKIGIELQNELVTVTVWNSGSRFPSKERTRIFERFYRGVDARQMAPGSGLGLYVARKIVQAHGGNLELENDSTPDREGVSFRLTMPIIKSDSDLVDKPA
jgi:two-component system, OmpR family, sensor histidine kinase KdpD